MSRKRLIPMGSFARDNFIKQCLLLSGLLLLFQIIYTLLQYSQLPPVVPFFLSLVKGEKQLANRSFILLLPITSTIFLAAHIYLSKINYQLDRLFARLVAASSFFVTLLLTIALAHIIIITT